MHAEEFDLALGPDADPLSATIMLLAHAREKRGFVSDRRGGVVPLNAAAESWWRMGVNDTLKKQNRRTYGEWLYDICELPPPIARPWFRPSDTALRAAARVFGGVAAGAGGRICFNTGAGTRWEEKRWKLRYYTELANLVRDRWPGAAIALVGGPGEKAFNATLLASNAGFVDAGTDNSIDSFAALIACADWCLTSDSLGYHMACAVGTPAVCVVGPTSPWELDCLRHESRPPRRARVHRLLPRDMPAGDHVHGRADGPARMDGDGRPDGVCGRAWREPVDAGDTHDTGRGRAAADSAASHRRSACRGPRCRRLAEASGRREPRSS